jgi:putative copper resistance protein D
MVVALVIISGIINTLFIVGWPLSWSSPYRVMLTMKIAVVLAMTMIATINRYWFVPRLGRDRERVLHAVRVGTLTEIGLGLTAIMLVSIFGMFDPEG